MKRWNTKQLSDLIKSLTGLDPTVDPQGSEHFTEELSIGIGDEFLILGGFIEDGDILDPSDEDVEHVYLFYLYDSSGDGLKSRDKKVRENYFKIKDALEDMGFDVVETYDVYF